MEPLPLPLPHLDPKNQQRGHRYSFLKAVRQQASPTESLDGLELEVSQEIARRSGRSPHGFFLPTDIQVGLSGSGRRNLERRDLTSSNGAGAIPKIIDPSRFIDVVREHTHAAALGAEVIDDLHGQFAIPRMTAGTIAHWTDEGDAPTVSELEIDQVLFQPKMIAARVNLSRRLLLQTGRAAEGFVLRDVARGIGTAIDRASFSGSGVGSEPLGILYHPDVPVIALGTNGGQPTWDKIVELEAVVANNEGEHFFPAYVTTPNGRNKLKITVRTGTTGEMIWQVFGSDYALNGYDGFATKSLPSDLTKGTGEDLSPILFGYFSALIIGLWELDIVVDPYTGGSAGIVRVNAFQHADVQLRHAHAFSRITDMITSV